MQIEINESYDQKKVIEFLGFPCSSCGHQTVG